MEWRHSRTYAVTGFLVWLIAIFVPSRDVGLNLLFGAGGAATNLLAFALTGRLEHALAIKGLSGARRFVIVAARFVVPFCIGILAVNAITLGIGGNVSNLWTKVGFFFLLHFGLLIMASFLLARSFVHGNIFLIGSSK